MNCLRCDSEIDKGESYVEWNGYDYCGTQCIIDHLKDQGELEEKAREDN